MAIAMSLTMSLVQTIARLGFAPNLASAWLTSFAIGVAVAIPTAILIAPQARRLAAASSAPFAAPRADNSSSTSSEGPAAGLQRTSDQREAGTAIASARQPPETLADALPSGLGHRRQRPGAIQRAVRGAVRVDRPALVVRASRFRRWPLWMRVEKSLRGVAAIALTGQYGRRAIARPPAQITIHGASVASRSRESIGPCRSQWKASG
jgi:hypothetical protein